MITIGLDLIKKWVSIIGPNFVSAGIGVLIGRELGKREAREEEIKNRAEIEYDDPDIVEGYWEEEKTEDMPVSNDPTMQYAAGIDLNQPRTPTDYAAKSKKPKVVTAPPELNSVVKKDPSVVIKGMASELEIIPLQVYTDGVAEDGKDFQKELLTYYVESKTLVDSSEKVVSEVEARAKIDRGLEHFGEQSGDQDVVYIRNYRYGVDYEVIRIHAAYGEPKVEPEIKPKMKKPDAKVKSRRDVGVRNNVDDDSSEGKPKGKKKPYEEIED